MFVSSDKSTVASYLNKEGDTYSFQLCALVWRILAWSNAREIQIRTKHIPTYPKATLQSHIPQESVISKSSCVVPGLLHEGQREFSVEVADRIKAP